jgi:hypothetical protein
MNGSNTDTLLDITTYDAQKTEGRYITNQLCLNIEDVDDLAIAWIVVPQKNNDLEFFLINDNPETPLSEVTKEYPKWLWREGGNHGEGAENITQWLHNNYRLLPPNEDKHVLYLTISIYDFRYEKWYLPGGKWSFSAQLTLDGEAIWNKTKFSTSSKKEFGAKYIKIFKLSLDTNDGSTYYISITESIEKTIAETIFDTILEKYNYHEVKYTDKKNGIGHLEVKS